MLLFNVNGEKAKVKAHRSQAGVPEYFLQAENITAVEEIILGEGMSESMRRASRAGDTGLPAVAAQHLLDAVSGQGLAFIIQQKPGNMR